MRARVSNSQSQSSSQQIQLSYSKNKPSIKLKQWMHSFKPINSFKLKQHILGYLIQQGLYDVAVSFSQQANIPFPKVNQENVKFRYAIKKQITNGNIDKVLQMIKKIQPQFQNDLKNSELLFKLKCLKVIKLIKQNRIKQSIQIAKKQLLPFSKNGQIYIKQIQKIMGLLAYVDLKKSPYYQITKNQYSNKIAKRINQHIINKNQQQIDQSLQTLLKIGKWCQNRLLNYIKFPKLNLSQNGQLFQQPMQWFLFLINYIQKFQYYNKYYQHQNMNRQSQQKAMHTLIDKLTDHLTPQRIQILIDNGFDQWQTITYLKGTQLVQLGFDMNQCIIIMVACNSVSNQLNQSDIFTQARMQQVLSLAKIQDQKRQNDLLKQQQLNQNNNYKNNQQEIISPQKNKNLISSPSSPVLIKQKPTKQITQRLISKCVYPKPRQGQKVNFKKITVLSLQQKQLTHIKNLQIIPNLQTLNLNTNFIQQITGLQTLYKIRVLSMQRNNLLSMKGLSSLINLQSLILNSNFISKIQGLQNCKYLKQLKLNRQKINGQLQIQQSSMISLSYSLQLLQIKNSKLKNIKPLKHLLCLRQANLQKNLIQEVSDLSQTLTTMQSLQILSLKQNPLTKSLKYRDYVVILNKTITQLDGKKILPKERQYLVKLYAMKHKRNNAEQKKQKIIKPSISLKGIKLQQQSYNTQPNINRATDLRGTGVYANTKVIRK